MRSQVRDARCDGRRTRARNGGGGGGGGGASAFLAPSTTSAARVPHRERPRWPFKIPLRERAHAAGLCSGFAARFWQRTAVPTTAAADPYGSLFFAPSGSSVRPGSRRVRTPPCARCRWCTRMKTYRKPRGNAKTLVRPSVRVRQTRSRSAVAGVPRLRRLGVRE